MKSFASILLLFLSVNLCSQINDTIHVFNSNQFLSAIQSNRTIIVNSKQLKFEKTLTLDNIHNLSITSEANTTLYFSNPNEDLISLHKSNTILFSKINVKSKVDREYCKGNVINATSSKNIQFLSCDISGAGKNCTNSDAGFLVQGWESHLIFRNNTLREISSKIHNENSQTNNISFQDCSFHLSKEDSINYPQLHFKNCTLYKGKSVLISKKYNGYYPKKVAVIQAEILTQKAPWHSEYDGGVFEGSCDNTCIVSATSTLNSTKKYNYTPKNLISFDGYNQDGKVINAWVEGVSGSGIGEKVIYEVVDILGSGEPWRMFLDFTIVNGYAKNLSTWNNNNRVKTLHMYRNGVLIAKIQLHDVPNEQKVNLKELGYKNYPNIGEIIEFEIVEVYKGKKYDDTAISLLIFDCAP